MTGSAESWDEYEARRRDVALQRDKIRAIGLAASRLRRGESEYEDPEVAYGPALPEWNPQPKHLEVEQNLRMGRRHNLLVGGSRSAKTSLYVKHLLRRALLADGSRHVMLRFRGVAARESLRLDTLPKVARWCFPQLRLEYHDGDGYALTPNGSEIWWGGLDEKERVEKVLGREFATIMLNEVSQIPFHSVLTVRTRLAQVCTTRTGHTLAQQELMDLNPVGKSHYTYREHILHVDAETGSPIDPEFVEREMYYAFLQPQDNAPNLDPRYLESLARAPARYRKRYYEGQYTEDVEGALWTSEAIDRCRASERDVPEDLDRVVVAIDPSGTDGDESRRSDDVGIVVMGRRGAGNDSVAWLIEDATCNAAPEEWGRRAVALYRKYRADRIVAERNFGGDMVRFVVDTAARTMGITLPPVVLVPASRAKHVHAEPVSILTGHEHNGDWIGCRMRHAGLFPLLEEELLNFSVYGYQGPKSPNRADAYVWAAHDLMLGEQAPSLWSFDSMRYVDR